MIIQVNPHRIVLNKTNEVNSGEYNVNECIFEFSQEYEGLTKVAVFSLCDGTTKNVTILNNQCIIPVECLQETGQVQIGVYGYATENGNLVLRYSPTPQNFVVRLGSYKEGTEPVAPTPTDWEILVEQVSDIAEDVSSIHEEISGINGEISGINTDIRDLQDTKANISDLAEVAFTGEFNDLKNIPSYATTQQLNQEIQDRQDADVNLQSQIDAISVSSDVVDVVGTYQELVDYDTQHLKDNDIVKVLQDSTHNNALSYYRWDKETSTWSYVGSEGPFYTRSETDALLNKKQDLIDIDNMLSSDLVDDTNSTNKFVTQADINNWNNKEDKSNKVTEINSSSTDTQYPSAKCVYNSQEEQNEHIAELEMLYNAFPTVSAENETIQLDNTAKVKFREIDLKGNTSQVVIPEEQGTSVSNTSIYVSDVDTDKENTIEISGNTYQETTSEINIYNVNGTQGQVSPEITIGSDFYVSCTYDNTSGSTVHYSNFMINRNDLLKTSTNYLIVCEIKSVSGSGRLYPFTKHTNSCMETTNTNYQFSTLSAGDKILIPVTTKSEFTSDTRFDLRTLVAYNVGESGSITFRLSLLTDTTITSDTFVYEKFTYGASPNPSYPQNIEVVTGTQNVEVCGKNLFNKSSTKALNGYFEHSGGAILSSNVNKVIYIKCQPNTTYSFRQGTTTLSNHVFQVATTRELPTINVIVENFVDRSSINNYSTFSYTTNEYAQYIVIRLRAGDYNSTFVDGVQIERNDTPTTYEAYQGNTYPVNLGNIELCKIGTYKDRIYKKNDKWYLEKKVGKVTLDGSEEWGTVQAYGRAWPVVEAPNILVSTSATDLPYLYCNYYNAYKLGDIVSSNPIDYGIGKRSNHSELLVRNKDADTVASLKTWLNTHNTIVYYALATPTTTEITDTTLVNQLNALYNANIYPITNINTDTSNLLPYIDLHYNFVTPSPSPSRPSVVNVVKGNNTITIANSDNTESQVFPINLGDMELCKIGTYQDYIYESNGNWFKKGNIGKVVLNGSENWSGYTNSQGLIYFYTGIDRLQVNEVICNKLVKTNNMWTQATHKNLISGSTNGRALNIMLEDEEINTVNKLLAWLPNNNLLVYYPLATPTDTQITDTTLITQLNNIKKAYSYDTQTNISQTNTDKPFIIYAEAIRSLKDVFE